MYFLDTYNHTASMVCIALLSMVCLWHACAWMSLRAKGRSRGEVPVQEAGVLGKVGVLLGGLAQDVPDLAQLQLAVLAGVRLVEQLLGVAQRLLLQQHCRSILMWEAFTKNSSESWHCQAAMESNFWERLYSPQEFPMGSLKSPKGCASQCRWLPSKAAWQCTKHLWQAKPVMLAFWDLECPRRPAERIRMQRSIVWYISVSCAPAGWWLHLQWHRCCPQSPAPYNAGP